jgi:membrane protein implicated in regulation of membrane protease activity
MGNLIDLAAANPFWVWAAAGAALLAVEIATGSGWLLWPAASAGVVAILSLVAPMDWLPATGLFAALTIVTTFAARRFMKRLRGHPGHDINDNIARLVGHHGKAVGAFAGRAGRVFIDGKEWAAELDEGEALAAGAPVEVTGVSGSHLRVRPAH